MHTRGEGQTPVAAETQGCVAVCSTMCSSVARTVLNIVFHTVPDPLLSIVFHIVLNTKRPDATRCNINAKQNRGDARQYKTWNPNTCQHSSKANNVSGTTQGLSNNEQHNTQLTKHPKPTECRPHPGSPDHTMGDRTKWRFSAKIETVCFNP